MTIEQANQYFAALPDGFASTEQLRAAFTAPVQKVQFVGVAGTAGKTVTARLLAAILQADGRRVGLIGTNGACWPGHRHDLNHTTPESCDLQALLRRMADDGCDTCIMEVSSLGPVSYTHLTLPTICSV